MGAIKAIKNGFLIDGTGKPPIENAVVVIDGSKIVAIGKDATIPSDAEVIDAAGKTVMPGLIDAHYHMYAVDDPTERNYPMQAAFTISMLKARPSMLALYSARNARRMLEAGFTAVRDLGGFTQWDNTAVVDLKRGIELGLVPGPRIVVAGWVAPMGGHGAPQMGLGTSWLMKVWTPDSSTPAADGPWEIRKRVRQLSLLGVDQIKTVASGGGGEPGPACYTFEELKAVVDEAHLLGKKVAVHAYGADDIKVALRAGVDTVEHCAYPDDEAVKLMLEKDAIGVATLYTASERAEKAYEWMGLPLSQDVKYMRASNLARRKECFQKMLKAGVKIALGTDVYFILMAHHGKSAFELELLTRFGMTPMQAIVAATKVGAEALDLKDKIGTLECGKLADLLVVDGNPLEDIKVLQDKAKIQMIMKNGTVEVNRGV